MVGSAIYSRIDPDTNAVFSKPVVTDLLRDRLSYDGVVITDDVGAAKAVADVPVGARATRFVEAGGDITLTARPATVPTMHDALTKKMNASPAFARQVQAAATRVVDLASRWAWPAAPSPGPRHPQTQGPQNRPRHHDPSHRTVTSSGVNRRPSLAAEPLRPGHTQPGRESAGRAQEQRAGCAVRQAERWAAVRPRGIEGGSVPLQGHVPAYAAFARRRAGERVPAAPRTHARRDPTQRAVTRTTPGRE